MELALLRLPYWLRAGFYWLRLYALRHLKSPALQHAYAPGALPDEASQLSLKNPRYLISLLLAAGEALLKLIAKLLRGLFYLNFRSPFELLLSAVKLVAVLGVGSLVLLYAYLSAAPDATQLASYQMKHQQSLNTALLDQSGVLVGAVAGEVSDGGLSVQMVPPVYWDMLNKLSGNSIELDYDKASFADLLFGRVSSYKGIVRDDVLNRGMLGHLHDGLLGDRAADSCAKLFAILCDGLSRMHFARHAFPYLAENSGTELKRWVATHGSLRGFQDDIRGLRAVANVAFDKLPEQLSNAEQALLAVAHWNAVPLLSETQTNPRELAALSLKKASEFYSRQQPALVVEIEKDLRRIRLPASRELAGRGDNVARLMKLPHLKERSEQLLGNYRVLVNQRLLEMQRLSGSDKVISDAQLTLPAAKNLKFVSAVEARLKRIERSCFDCGLHKRLSATSDVQNAAQVQLLVSDDQGKLVRYYSRGEVSMRDSGALSAIPAAVLLATQGIDPQQRFCNRSFRNLGSSLSAMPKGVGNCEDLEAPGHSVSFLESLDLAESLPLFNALRSVSDSDELTQLYRNFDATDLRTRQNKPTHREQFAYEMAYGHLQSTPLQQLAVMHALSDVLYGSGEAPVIRSISQFLIKDIGAKRRYLEFSKPDAQLDIRRHYLRNQSSRQQLQTLLSSGGRLLLEKTASNRSDAGGVRDHWLLGSLLVRNKRYSVSLFIGSPTSDELGLADNLPPERIFRPLVAEIIESLD